MGLVSGLLFDSVMIATATTASVRGQASYGAPTAVTARVERIDLTAILGPAGEEGQVDTVLFTEAPLRLSDRVWLPGESSADATKARKVMRVEKVHTIDGQLSHYRSYV